MDLYSNLSHINVNVLRPLCTCCVIIVLIVHKAVVKGQECVSRRGLSGGNDGLVGVRRMSSGHVQ